MFFYLGNRFFFKQFGIVPHFYINFLLNTGYFLNEYVSSH